MSKEEKEVYHYIIKEVTTEDDTTYFLVEFSEISGLSATGSTIESALDNAEQALYRWLDEQCE